MIATILFLANVAVRNPFWPIGYEGPLEEITAEPRIVATKPVVAEDTKTAAEVAATRPVEEKGVQPKDWLEARRSLRIGGTTTINCEDGKCRQCVMINGNVYGNGDLLSINFKGRRFTWRVAGLTNEESLRLVRVRARDLTERKE